MIFNCDTFGREGPAFACLEDVTRFGFLGVDEELYLLAAPLPSTLFFCECSGRGFLLTPQAYLLLKLLAEHTDWRRSDE